MEVEFSLLSTRNFSISSGQDTHSSLRQNSATLTLPKYQSLEEFILKIVSLLFFFFYFFSQVDEAFRDVRGLAVSLCAGEKSTV